MIEPSATASTGKNIPGLIVLDQSRNVMHILLAIIHSMKKASLYDNEFHTSKVSLSFSIYLFHSTAGRKKIHSLRTQFAAGLIYSSYLLLLLQLFAFANVFVSFWQTRNNNKLTKGIILLSPRQISKKFLDCSVNAFSAKKNTCDSFGNLFAENLYASLWQENIV